MNLAKNIVNAVIESLNFKADDLQRKRAENAAQQVMSDAFKNVANILQKKIKNDD
jgi:hypothetical protein